MPFSDFMPGAMALLKMVEMVASMVRSQDGVCEESDYLCPDDPTDLGPECIQETAGELVVSHYPDGTIRMENVKSGVIQEERADGSLTVSLPHGKLLSQRYEGEPLLVLDLENPGPPLLAHVAYLSIEGTRSLVYHYEDPRSGHHIIELSSLRYFKGNRRRTSDGLFPGWQSVAGRRCA